MNYKDQNNDLQVKELSALATAKPEQGAQARSALGTNAKSSGILNDQSLVNTGSPLNSSHTLLEHIESSTGEVIPFKKNKFNVLVENVSSDKIITDRYLLQSCSRELMPFSRTAKCNRLSCGSDVGVLKNLEFKSTSFSGLQTCGSPWACTVCSSKISERRKNEVVCALEQHVENKGSVYFVTFTFSHSRNENLQILRDKQKIAFKALRSSRGYLKYKKLVGYSGLIRALEVTWGLSNGWHPHTHEIIFGDVKASFQSIKRLLFPEWKKACLKAGLSPPSFRRGVDVQGGEKAGSYLTKYGDELTKGHMKKAKGDRFSPFDLLRSYFYDDVDLHGQKFVEFAEGMQGSRQLYWTNGLKDKFSINEKSDDQLAHESQANSLLLGNIPLEKWKAVIKYEARSSLLIIANTHGFIDVMNFVNSLFEKYETSGDLEKERQRVKQNRLRFKNVKNSAKDRLTTFDQRDYFDKLNDSIQASKNLASSASLYPDLTKFTNDLNQKYFVRQKEQFFMNDNYSKKKTNLEKIKNTFFKSDF